MTATKRDQLAALRATALDRTGEAVDPTDDSQHRTAPADDPPTAPQKRPASRSSRRRRSSTPTPKSTTPARRSATATSELPTPARRIHRAEDEEIERIAVDLPSELEPYREAAKAAGMTKSHLVLSVIETHGPSLRTEAADGQALLPFTGAGPRVRWLLELSPAEHTIVTDLIDEIGPAMPRKKNAAVIGLIMAKAAGLH